MNSYFFNSFYKKAASAGGAIGKFISRHGLESLGKSTASKILKNTVEHGSPSTGSLALSLLKLPASLVIPKQTLNNIGKKVTKGAIDLDMIAGKPLDSIFGRFNLTKNLFKTTEKIPLGKDKYKIIRRASVTKPLAAASGVVVPIAAMSQLSDWSEKLKESRKSGQEQII